jgi:hypothetical protein
MGVSSWYMFRRSATHGQGRDGGVSEWVLAGGGGGGGGWGGGVGGGGAPPEGVSELVWWVGVCVGIRE